MAGPGSAARPGGQAGSRRGTRDVPRCGPAAWARCPPAGVLAIFGRARIRRRPDPLRPRCVLCHPVEPSSWSGAFLLMHARVADHWARPART